MPAAATVRAAMRGFLSMTGAQGRCLSAAANCRSAVQLMPKAVVEQGFTYSLG